MLSSLSFTRGLSKHRPSLLPTQPPKRAVATLSLYSLHNVFGILKNVTTSEDRMLEMTKYLHPRKSYSKNFGEVYETFVVSHRVWFQPNKVIIGDFEDSSKVEEYYTLGRIPDMFLDHKGEAIKGGHLLDRDQKLDPYIILPDACALKRSFFSEGCKDGSIPALKIPTVFTYLPRLSSMVKSVAILKEHDGVSFEYEWDTINHIDEFRYDLYIGIKVLEAMEELRPPKNSDE